MAGKDRRLQDRFETQVAAVIVRVRTHKSVGMIIAL